MRNTIKALIFWVGIAAFGAANTGAEEAKAEEPEAWPTLKGPYLGQPLPGMVPQIFAPGLISTDAYELNAVLSPDQKIFMFSRTIGGVYKMFYSYQRRDGIWREPQMAGPSKAYPNHRDADMMFSPQQDWLYFISDRPLPGYSLDRYNIWKSRIGAHGLETPIALPATINGPNHELYPMIVADGSLYFTSDRPDSLGDRDSYRAQYKDGQFLEPVNLGPAINSKNREGDIFVNPDETMLIHVSANRDGGFGGGDLYISFKDKAGNWLPSRNMGAGFNSPGLDFCPMLSPDGKVFFFSRGGQVYWVDAKALEAFRP